MKKKDLMLRLVLPLGVLFLISIFIHYEKNSFFLNLATELLSIIITITYVNFVLENLSKRNWKIVEKRVFYRLRQFMYNIIAYTDMVFYKNRTGIKFNKSINLEEDKGDSFILFLVNDALPNIENKVEQIDDKTLDEYMISLEYLQSDIKQIFADYGEKLPAELYAYVIDAKDLLFHTINSYYFYTKKHNINSKNLLKIINEGGHPIFNRSYITSLKKNSKILLIIAKCIYDYLKRNYNFSQDKWPYMVEYKDTTY